MFREPREFRVQCTLVAALVGATVTVTAIAQAPARRPPAVLFSAPLADAPGKQLVVVELKFAPNPSPPSTARIGRIIGVLSADELGGRRPCPSKTLPAAASTTFAESGGAREANGDSFCSSQARCVIRFRSGGESGGVHC